MNTKPQTDRPPVPETSEAQSRRRTVILVLFCLAGMYLMLHTTNLIMVLIGLEVFSLALYVMTGSGFAASAGKVPAAGVDGNHPNG